MWIPTGEESGSPDGKDLDALVTKVQRATSDSVDAFLGGRVLSASSAKQQDEFAPVFDEQNKDTDDVSMRGRTPDSRISSVSAASSMRGRTPDSRISSVSAASHLLHNVFPSFLGLETV
jgi:hypothetical protein